MSKIESFTTLHHKMKLYGRLTCRWDSGKLHLQVLWSHDRQVWLKKMYFTCNLMH